ncbi:aspartate aminotransferase family protein [Albibacterium indicum]|uniref:aspartate aminotransferase family protein n=1 Tax=Albibacterium indicum TaxID=2292082 RepID=UPI000E48CAAE|nr:aminotransferase class III-fold pyridoxal phosphate-dependent enzyme [Pedobacter indicus]
MKLFDVYPLNEIEIERASGLNVWDKHGQKYLDLYGGHAVISIGHTHPHYVDALTNQLNKVAFYSNSVLNPLQEKLADLLGELSGKQNYSLFLCSTGAEANENALKVASFYNKRKKVIAFKGAFHGRTSLAVACTDNPKIVSAVNKHDVVFLPFNDEDALEKAFSEYGDAVSAVIVESIQGVGGIQEATPLFLAKIRELTTAYDAVFIADEVQCGYGRSGQFYAQAYSHCEADIYTMAKGMGNGFPIAGISLSPKFKPWHGMLGTTFGGSHLACAAGIAVLEIMEKEGLIENAKNIGTYLLNELRTLDKIQEVRGRGLMIGIDLPAELNQIRKELLFDDHIFTGVASPNVIRLLPALNITKDDADFFLDALKKRLQKA